MKMDCFQKNDIVMNRELCNIPLNELKVGLRVNGGYGAEGTIAAISCGTLDNICVYIKWDDGWGDWYCYDMCTEILVQYQGD